MRRLSLEFFFFFHSLIFLKNLIEINYLLARNNPTASSTSDFKRKNRILRIASILKHKNSFNTGTARIEISVVHQIKEMRGAKMLK